MSDVTRLIGTNIRTYRRAGKMTIDELADRIHKSKATVGKYEQGSISVDVDTLFELAAALGVSPALLLQQTVPESPAQSFPTVLSASRRYLYLYDGRKSRIVRSLLMHADEGDAVTLFYDIVSFDEPQRCRVLYFGRCRTHDFVTNYLLDNQSSEMEHLFICLMRSIDKAAYSAGLLSGISSRMLLPASSKCILSREPLPETEALKEELLLTKEDLRLTKRYNMFMVEQISP